MPIAALVGLPVYVCASGSTPFAAVLVAKGLSPGAALAFLLTGPATNVTTFGVVRSLHGTRAAVVFALGVAAGAVGLGLLVDFAFRGLAVGSVAAEPATGMTPIRAGALAALAAVYLASVLRLGVRGFLAPLFDVPNAGERGSGEAGHHHHGTPAEACGDCG